MAQYGTGSENVVAGKKYFTAFQRYGKIKITKIEYQKSDNNSEMAIFNLLQESSGLEGSFRLYKVNEDKVNKTAKLSKQENVDFQIKLTNRRFLEVEQVFLPPAQVGKIKGDSFKMFVLNFIEALTPYLSQKTVWLKFIKNQNGYSAVSFDCEPFIIEDTGQDPSQVQIQLPFTTNDYKYKDATPKKSEGGSTDLSQTSAEDDDNPLMERRSDLLDSKF